MNDLIRAERSTELTGWPSIDKPWLQFYDKDAYDKATNTPKDKSVWEVYKPIILDYDLNTPIIKYFNKSFTGGEYAALIRDWAKTFRAMGIEQDEMVPIYGTWSPDISAMFFALNAIGAHPYFQKLDITPEALEKETVGAKVGVIHSTLWGNVQDVFKQNRFQKVIVSRLYDHVKGPLKGVLKVKTDIDALKEGSTIPKDSKFINAPDALAVGEKYTGDFEVPFKPGRIASVTSSSGTTSSVVKGIMDTNESILASLLSTTYSKPNYIAGKKVLTSTPPTASTSLNCLFLLPIMYKMTIVMDPRVSEEGYYKQIMDTKPSITIITGSYMETLFRTIEEEINKGKKIDLSFADFYTIGGSGTTPDKLKHMNEIMEKCSAPSKLVVGYGSSEFFGVVTVDKYDKENSLKDKKDVTDVGIPIAGYIVAVFDENGNEVPYNTRGELYISGPALMEGYFGKPELTAASIKDGWFKTGDIGEIDENGYVYFYGRKKDTVEVNGNTIYLFDIANALRVAFDLKDCMAEKKMLEDGTPSVVVYFVQKEGKEAEQKDLCLAMDEFIDSKGPISIDGYREYTTAFPTSPTTLKPVTRVMDGFVKYTEDGTLDISYGLTDEDDVLIINKAPRSKN